MGQAERDLIDERFANLTSEEYRVRLNAGQGWAGEIVKRTQTTLTLKNPRAFWSSATRVTPTVSSL